MSALTSFASPTSATEQPHFGGTLYLSAGAAGGTIDPQINYEEKFNQVFAFLYDGLLTFRKTSGDAGLAVVPDLAEAMPEIRDSGTTYVFTLRRGVKFSTGQEVGVADVVASFQRLFKVSSPNAGSWYNVIAGGDACLKTPASCTLEGGVIADQVTRKITFHLVRPSGEFLQQLAMSFAVILPADTPTHDLGTIPAASTGPYMVENYNPTRRLRIVRNPYFREWSGEAQPAGYVDEMLYRFGLQDESELTEVEHGQLDWMFDEKPLDRLAEIGSHYTSLAHLNTLPAYYYLELNVNLPPFDRLEARQAVAFAVNRRAAVNLFGGPGMGVPLCHLLPSGIPGSTPYCPFTKNPGSIWSAPDLERPRALVQKSGTAGMKVTLITSDKEVERSLGIYLQSVLSDIGYQASVRALSSNIDFPYKQNTNNRVQIGLTDWFMDYPAASDFLGVMYACANFHPGSDSSINMAGFCDRGIDAEMDRAEVLGASDPAEASALWSKIDREITDRAPGIGLFQVNYLDVVAPRVGNYMFSPIYHMLFAKAWVQ